VGDAARRIEAENFRLVFSDARILLAPVAEQRQRIDRRQWR
jgi:hypothetical protein